MLLGWGKRIETGLYRWLCTGATRVGFLEVSLLETVSDPYLNPFFWYWNLVYLSTSRVFCHFWVFLPLSLPDLGSDKNAGSLMLID